MPDDPAPRARRILLVGWDGGGNVPPMLALGKRLARRGHRVRMVGHDTISGGALAAGIDFAPFVSVPSWVPRPGRDHSGDDERDRFFAYLTGPELGEELLSAALSFGPDVLVVDCMAGGALSAAEHLALPCVVLVHLRARVLYDAKGSRPPSQAEEALNVQRARLGLSPVDVEQGLWRQLWQRAGRVCVASLPELAGPGEPLPAGFTYFGGIFDPDPEPLPPDVAAVAGDGAEPLVVVSFSTTYMHQEGQVATAISAVSALRGVVTLGADTGLDRDDFSASGSLVLTRWAPHEALLPRASAVVTHAGHGTVMAALAAGVPLVCMPMGRDQHGNAEQVVRLGAGVSIDPFSGAPELRAAIDEVISEPGFRASAECLAASMRQLGGGERLVAEIETGGER